MNWGFLFEKSPRKSSKRGFPLHFSTQQKFYYSLISAASFSFHITPHMGTSRDFDIVSWTKYTIHSTSFQSKPSRRFIFEQDKSNIYLGIHEDLVKIKNLIPSTYGRASAVKFDCGLPKLPCMPGWSFSFDPSRSSKDGSKW